jgi:tetratricopeptide (TPR) repeat protein
MQLSGSSPAALINRALTYQAQGDEQLALCDLNAAIAAGARQTRVYFIRAAVRHKLNDVTGSREDFQKGLSLTPTDCTSWLARGMAHLNRSPELALADFQEAMRLEPGNRLAVQNALHVLSDRLQRDEESLELVGRLIATNPRDARALITRAVLQARQGDVKKAAEDATTAIALQSDPKMLLQAACAFAQCSTTAPRYRATALQLLARSIGAEPTLAVIAVKDPDLEPLGSSSDFHRILDAAEVIGNGGAASAEEATVEP